MNCEKATGGIVTITPSQVGSMVVAFYNAKRPMFLVGPPGVGKSACVKQAADMLRKRMGCFGFIDQRMSQRNPVDLQGVPGTRFRAERIFELAQLYRAAKEIEPHGGFEVTKVREQFTKELNALVNDGFSESMTTLWGPPSWLPNAQRDGEHGIFFLDELTSAGPEVQAACYQLIQDRRIGDYTLPENWVVIAAGNRVDDRAIVYQASSALNNKFGHFEVRVSWDDWRTWAYAHDVHRDVIAFNAYRNGQTLFLFDPESETTVFPTPRTWEYTSDVLKANEGDEFTEPTLDDCAKALIGEYVGSEFVAFRRLASSMPDIEGIIETYRAGNSVNWYSTCNTAACRLGSSSGISSGIGFMTVVGLAQRASAENAELLWRIASDMTRQGVGDFSVLLVIDAMAKDNDAMQSCPMFDEWCEQNHDLMERIKIPCL